MSHDTAVKLAIWVFAGVIALLLAAAVAFTINIWKGVERNGKFSLVAIWVLFAMIIACTTAGAALYVIVLT